jgi:adenine phosphoribosyltransferase
MALLDLKDYIRDVPDFPTPGILFRDITPLLKSPDAFRQAIAQFAERYRDARLDAIAGIESRGFLFATPLSHELRVPMVPVRKKGKLPARTHSVSYDLEYGSDALEMHVDAISSGDRVLIVDDLLATGGTLAATSRLISLCGGEIAGVAVVVELTELNGRNGLDGYDIFSLLRY